jgi:hypothetical protein
MNRSSQLPGTDGFAAGAGLPSRMPVAISCGHRFSASSTVIFAWSGRSGSLNPSRTEPLSLANSSSLGFTNVSFHIIGTAAQYFRFLNLQLSHITPGVSLYSQIDVSLTMALPLRFSDKTNRCRPHLCGGLK